MKLFKRKHYNLRHENDIIELIVPIYRNEVDEFDLMISSGELVRCKNCKYAIEDMVNAGYYACKHSANPLLHKGDWFCADGKAKKVN